MIAILSRGYLTVDQAIECLAASIVGNPRVVEPVREANECLANAGLPGKAAWPYGREQAHSMLYDAVVRGELKTYAWPARLDDSGFHIASAPQTGFPIHPSIIVAVKPEHGGLPTHDLGIRAPTADRLMNQGVVDIPHPDSLVLFRKDEFVRWAMGEKQKMQFPSQQNRKGKRKLEAGRPPEKKAAATELVQLMVELGDWTKKLPVSQLAREVRRTVDQWDLGRDGNSPTSEAVRVLRRSKYPLSDDTVARALDELYVVTGDPRYQRKGRRQKQLRNHQIY